MTLCVTDSCLRVEARPGITGYFRVDLLHAVLNKLVANASLVLVLTVVNFARPTCVIVACFVKASSSSNNNMAESKVPRKWKDHAI